MGSSCISDSMISIVLCYCLRKCRSGMKRTEHIINCLLLYTINTGLLASTLGSRILFASFVQIQIHASLFSHSWRPILGPQLGINIMIERSQSHVCTREDRCAHWATFRSNSSPATVVLRTI
ncbi:hypothetical protein PAXRUDRAFT_213765 [Paxillus rubicundulus Ve08.2h10]|uniref:DUF6534 domain-containing protein n=1 Tax=Paxillus rubicundulus Ve08.2h10 TaxID=930991 RepID=A0A0D0CZ36_9AGAM|nr:hypothetical protein PAXRUDRAFT_213765 [Paxillus rubicundulus Ve08.2h10]